MTAKRKEQKCLGRGWVNISLVIPSDRQFTEHHSINQCFHNPPPINKRVKTNGTKIINGAATTRTTTAIIDQNAIHKVFSDIFLRLPFETRYLVCEQDNTQRVFADPFRRIFEGLFDC